MLVVFFSAVLNIHRIIVGMMAEMFIYVCGVMLFRVPTFCSVSTMFGRLCVYVSNGISARSACRPRSCPRPLL